MTVLYCGIDHDHEALIGVEPCGCVAAASVLTHHEADAYKDAARDAKQGLRVERVSTEHVRTMSWSCPDHPHGPPWWKSNGGKGKRPATYTREPEPIGMGL